MRTTIIRAFGVTAALGSFAVAIAQQAGAPMKEAMEAKLAAVKQAAAANKAALQHYTWTETVQVALNGEVKSTKVMSCSYGPNGQVVKTPIGPPPAEPKGGPLRRRVAEEKKDELTGYMEQVKAVIGLYVPPDAGRMQQAHQAGNLSLGRPAAGEAGLVFKNYAQPGDAMTLDFSTAARKLAGLNVNTYVGDPSQPVTLTVQFASLPDGTNYPASVVVNAPAKKIQVTTTNSNYQKLAGP
jgi:hypothetical protein